MVEVAIVGDPRRIRGRVRCSRGRSGWRPFEALAADSLDASGRLAAVPLLPDRIAVGGQPTAYVCRGFVCDLPVTDAAALEARLAV